MKRKWAAFGIIFLFVGTCLISATAQYTEKPFPAARGKTTYVDDTVRGSGHVNWTVNGTMGWNGIYISPLTFTCTYDNNSIAQVWYEIDGFDYTLYIDPFIIDIEGHIEFWWYCVDYQGNIGEVQGPYCYKIDYTPPVVWLIVKKIGLMKWLFSAEACDWSSAINHIEFYLDGLFLGNVTSEPFELIWTGSGTHTLQAIAYDSAGNNANSTTSISYSLCQIQNGLLQQRISRIIQNFIFYRQILFEHIWY